VAAGVVNDLGSLYRQMGVPRRRQLWLIMALMPVAAVAEMVTIGAVVPFLAILAAPGTPRSGLPWLPAFLPSSTNELLLMAAALFASAVVAASLIRLFLTWSTQRFAFGLEHDFAVEIQRRVLLQPYSFHLSRNSSEILSSLDKVELLVFSVILQLGQGAAAAIIALFVILALVQVDAPSAMVAALLVIILYGLVLLVTRRRLTASADVIGSAYEQRLQAVQESLGGIRDVILDHSQAAYLEVFRRIDARLMRARIDMALVAAAPRYLVEALGIVLITVLALFIAGREGGLVMALPVLGALALGAQRLLPLTQQIYGGWTALGGSRPIISQIVELLELPILSQPASDPLQPISFEREIRLDGVGYSYPDRQHAAIEAITLSIPNGARAALIGATGSGKSTLADLLMGLIEPSRGRIMIDGVDLTPEIVQAWQPSIAHVPQSVFLADTSIARNIAFSSPDAEPDMERVVRSAATAQLADFIESLPDGYDTVVGERGVRLSGGQRQRLGLARAIYKQAPLLVLDEATSALDSETEAAVLRSLDELVAQGRTILIIAHRQSTIANCDLVIRLENGRVVSGA